MIIRWSGSHTELFTINEKEPVWEEIRGGSIKNSPETDLKDVLFIQETNFTAIIIWFIASTNEYSN